MKIVRYLNATGQTRHGVLQPDGTALPLVHDLFTSRETASATEAISQLLAPLDPRVIFCIGLNYRKHAAEGKQPIPPYPVVFMKSPAAVQHPGGNMVRAIDRLAGDLLDPVRTDRTRADVAIAWLEGSLVLGSVHADTLCVVVSWRSSAAASSTARTILS